MDLTKWQETKSEYLRALSDYDHKFRRSIIDEIDWEDRLVFIIGARGVGKTTIMLQYITETFGTSDKVLYVSMDSLALIDISILDIAKEHHERGGTHLFVDEVHKYPRWSQELKNIYDSIKSLNVIASGSNILEIQKGQADLSRRAVEYTVEGLSLREFINIEANTQIPQVSLEDLLKDHVNIAKEITQKIKPKMYWDDYLRFGYYPFYLESKKSYSKKLNNTLNLTLEVDLPQMLGVDVSKIDKLKKLIYILTTQVPFLPNIRKLSEHLELNRNTLTSYLQYLEKGSILRLLWNKGKSYTLMTKPDKIYLHNPNLYFITTSNHNIGTMRECFFASQIGRSRALRLPLNGDFIVDNQYTFEIGGSTKGNKQIAGVPDSYAVQDDQMIGIDNQIPLWLFGFIS